LYQLHETLELEVKESVAAMKRGDRHEYFRGDLARGRHHPEHGGSNLPDEVRHLRIMAAVWRRMAERGLVQLFQKRLAEGDYSYLAVRQ
jgi:hypothetical protein